VTSRNILESLVGRTVQVTRHEFSWGFDFGDRCHLTVETLWRLKHDHLLLTSDDDKQQFGLPSPINAEREANRILHGLLVKVCRGDSVSGDLLIAFSTGVDLEIISSSSGYESWVGRLGDDIVVGRNE
jgi:Family of unknown function (DUF6188)